MNVATVESTTLTGFSYDEAGGILQLEFRSGAGYEYFGVPAAVHEGLLASSSKGGYFNGSIRGRFRYARVSSGTLGSEA
jgi:lysyl-tRNA synthetase class 2